MGAENPTDHTTGHTAGLPAQAPAHSAGASKPQRGSLPSVPAPAGLLPCLDSPHSPSPDRPSLASAVPPAPCLPPAHGACTLLAGESAQAAPMPQPPWACVPMPLQHSRPWLSPPPTPWGPCPARHQVEVPCGGRLNRWAQPSPTLPHSIAGPQRVWDEGAEKPPSGVLAITAAALQRVWLWSGIQAVAR